MRLDPPSDLPSTRPAGSGSAVRLLVLVCALCGLVAFDFARQDLVFPRLGMEAAQSAASDRPTARAAGSASTHIVVTGGRELVFRAGPGGHFMIDAHVNGDAVQFLFDSGASHINPSRADAERLGFDLERLDYTRAYNSANGVVRGAPVTLREIRVGQATFHDVEATVIDAEMRVSLLGMSFLNRLDGFEVARDTLIPRRNPFRPGVRGRSSAPAARPRRRRRCRRVPRAPS